MSRRSITTTPPMVQRTPNRRGAAAWAADIVAVIVFVAIGRRSHDEGGNAFTGAASVAAPFLIALAVGWIVARAWRSPLTIRAGTIVWACTVALGLVLRRTAFDRGTAPAFVIVATVTLGVFLVGWRGLYHLVQRRRDTR